MNPKKILLLDRCRQQGYISPADLDIVYSFSEPITYWQSKRLGKIKLQILRSLELEGYLIKAGDLKWKLTQKGVDELNRYMHQRIKTKKLVMKRIAADIVLPCDICRKRLAVYITEDNTRLCDACLTGYLREHGIRAYEVRLA